MNIHRLIDALVSQARDLDPEYADACADSCNTNEEPTTPEQRIVAELISTALMLNAWSDGQEQLRLYRDNLGAWTLQRDIDSGADSERNMAECWK